MKFPQLYFANLLKLLLVTFTGLILAACAAVGETNSRDPHESSNRSNFLLNESADEGFMLGLAQNYQTNINSAIRQGIANFFDNLHYPNTLLNNLLQGKVDRGISDIARLAINSTIGILGWFDVASEFGLAKFQEDLGQTFAVWGMDAGDYLYLPLLGPYTDRYVPDFFVRNAINPILYLEVPIALPLIGLDLIQKRAALIGQTEARDDSALDSYLFTREAFLQQRRFLIYDGNLPTQELDDFFDL